MGQGSTHEDFESQFNDVISRLESKQFFQSEWDIGFGVVFLVFIGLIVLLVLLVLIRCCCCCCCDEKPKHQRVGIENMCLEP
ncbi:small integral membrane protein 22 [Syngnathus acus]|uniref:small integral membrane protein 22 n=1 Tax=Syngnathus acus TaxID=161584 RepID=UPI001885D146|nr:small integral membrane protein 22 [Syngnathus acus]XP_037112163.1 small integral membrane protein 22 [Syngnathus acus]XP_037112164.1 small integral membrane protein 22 [Syngnathus acus]